MSPAVEVKNASDDGSLVRNVKIVWNGYHLLDIPGPMNRCGGGLEQNFNIRGESDLFGPVHVEWQNAKGETLTKDFTFTKKDFPTFTRKGHYVYHYVVLYFTQSDVEYYTSDNPHIEEIRKEKAADWRIADGKCVRECSQEYVKARPLSRSRCLSHKNFKNSTAENDETRND